MIDQKLDWCKEDKTETIRKNNEEEFSDDFNIGFLRGLMDTDGTLKGNWYVYNTISRNLAEDISYSLSELDIDNYVRVDEDSRQNCRNIFRVNINKKNSLKFQKLVRPRHENKKHVI